MNRLPDCRLLIRGPPGGRGEGVSYRCPDGRRLGGSELPVSAPRGRPRCSREGIPDRLRDGRVAWPLLPAVVSGAAHHKYRDLRWERSPRGQRLDDGVPMPEHLLERKEGARLGVAEGKTLKR